MEGAMSPELVPADNATCPRDPGLTSALAD